MADEKKPAEQYLLPEGRVINHSLFVRDQYVSEGGDEGKPSYKIELAFEKGVLDDLYNKCCDVADEKWGKGAGDEESFIVPILDGDKLKAKREDKGKVGDAYGGMEVIRAKTIYNKFGAEADGGIQVFAPDVSEIGPANQGEVYQGCYGHAAIVFNPYIKKGTNGEEDRKAVSFYLNAFQKTKDGEKLVTGADHSQMFKPVGRTGGGDGGSTRRRRKG